jgi:hypothetical protein
MKPLHTLIFVGALSVALVPNSLATSLPVQPASVVPSTTTGMPGTHEGDYTFSFTNAGETGVVNEDVYSYNGGFDFYYQVTNIYLSGDSLSRLTLGNFSGVTTSVFYEPDSGSLTSGNTTVTQDNAPTDATRHSGTTIGFDFDLAPGQSSDWLEVVTNARATTQGSISVIDDFTSSTNQALGPEVVAPEPPTWILLGLSAVAGLVFNFRRLLPAR